MFCRHHHPCDCRPAPHSRRGIMVGALASAVTLTVKRVTAKPVDAAEDERFMQLAIDEAGRPIFHSAR